MADTVRADAGTRGAARNPTASRAAVLEAAIAILQECGYAGTSVRAVARRAGVSQGALQHHFPTKAALVEAALLKLAAELVEQALERSATLPDSVLERCERVLDMLWEVHNLPIAHVVTELIVAARTDPALSRGVTAATEYAHALTVGIAAQVLPELAARADFADWILTCVATMRGLVVMASLEIEPEHSVHWSRARALLVAAISD
ncbi:helix-turn-helix domain-containing protein [Tsukamurella soli]